MSTRTIGKILCLLTMFWGKSLYAYCQVDVSYYVGWQITYAGTVTGYIDEDGVVNDHFEGCEWGRVLIVDYNKSVTCSAYNYSYAFFPEIVILSDGLNMVACINNEIYDIRR